MRGRLALAVLLLSVHLCSVARSSDIDDGSSSGDESELPSAGVDVADWTAPQVAAWMQLHSLAVSQTHKRLTGAELLASSDDALKEVGCDCAKSQHGPCGRGLPVGPCLPALLSPLMRPRPPSRVRLPAPCVNLPALRASSSQDLGLTSLGVKRLRLMLKRQGEGIAPSSSAAQTSVGLWSRSVTLAVTQFCILQTNPRLGSVLLAVAARFGYVSTCRRVLMSVVVT
jgi:hypothetical protein